MTGTAARNLRATAGRVAAVPRVAMVDATDELEDIAAREGARAGAPIKGHKRRGMPMRAKVTLTAAGTAVTARVQGVMVTAWVWRSDGTRGHAVRRRKRGPMARMTVRHPGSTGTGAWGRVEAAAARIVPTVFTDAVRDAVRG